MYCPNCAAPIEGVKFCRSCGANVSLVPQALTGDLPLAPLNDKRERRRQREAEKHNRPATIEKAVGSTFSGLGFLLAALFVTFRFPGGFTWGWSFLFPAFALLGEGIGQYLKLQEQRRRLNPYHTGAPLAPPYQQPLPPSAAQSIGSSSPSVAPTPTTSDLTAHQPAQPSVTEQTTRHLDASHPPGR